MHASSNAATLCSSLPRLSLPAAAREFLLGQRQSSAPYHKSVAYRSRSGRITGCQATRPADAGRLREILRDFSRHAERFTGETLAPGAVWMIFTDMVSHAVLSGQYAVEQTLIVSRRVMLRPELSPVGVLERLCGCPVTD